MSIPRRYNLGTTLAQRSVPLRKIIHHLYLTHVFFYKIDSNELKITPSLSESDSKRSYLGVLKSEVHILMQSIKDAAFLPQPYIQQAAYK